MALTDLIFVTKQPAQVGIVQFDCGVSETHTSEATVTEHPVEEGADVSDHIRLSPEMIEINGIVSNTPIVFLASVEAPSPLEDDLVPATDRVQVAYAELRGVMKRGEPVDVITSLRVYENMAIVGMSVMRDNTTGNVLNCSLSLREIIIAQTKTVPVPEPVEVANKKPVDKGKKTKKKPKPKQEEKGESIGISIGKGLGLFE